MIVEFDKSFDKSLDRIKDPSLRRRIERTIIQIEKLDSISKLPNIKKLSGFSVYYRIRIGEYRLGIEAMDKTTIRMIILAHRKDIYRFFP